MITLADSVLYEALPYALVAFGLVLTYRYLRLIDLTFAASFVLGPAIAGALLIQGTPFGISILVAFAAVFALGLNTLGLMWLLEIDGLLAGLLTSFAGIAIALLFTQGTLSLHDIATPFDAFKAFDYPWVDGVIPLHPSQIGLFFVLVFASKALVDFFLDSELGLAFRAMEDERSRVFLLKSIGISEWLMVGIGLIFGNFMSGTAGILVMLKEGQVTASRGFDAFLVVIAAYLLGHVLFERRPIRERNRSLARIFQTAAMFKPTGAALLGLLFYFLLLGLISRTALPASLPRLFMVGAIIVGFAATRWSEIRGRWTQYRADRSFLDPDGAAFEAASVDISYPGYPEPTTVIHDLNFAFPPHAAVLLQGPNGSGKTTLLRYLGGISPGHGTVSIPSGSTARRRRISNRRPFIGYISQDAQLASSATLTVMENLALFSRASGARFWRKWKWRSHPKTSSIVSTLVNRMGHEPAGHLSGGQRQILNIAEVMVRPDSPEVVLFDEPLTHLDEENALACVQLIESMAEQGRIIMIVQHDAGPTSDDLSSEARLRLAKLLTATSNVASLQGQRLPPGNAPTI